MARASPEDQREQVFLPFQRLGDRDDDTPQAGLTAAEAAATDRALSERPPADRPAIPPAHQQP